MLKKTYIISAKDINAKGTLGGKRIRVAQIATGWAISKYFGVEKYAPAMSIDEHEELLGKEFDYYETPLELVDGRFITPVTGLHNGAAIICEIKNDGSAEVTFC